MTISIKASTNVKDLEIKYVDLDLRSGQRACIQWDASESSVVDGRLDAICRNARIAFEDGTPVDAGLLGGAAVACVGYFTALPRERGDCLDIEVLDLGGHAAAGGHFELRHQEFVA